MPRAKTTKRTAPAKAKPRIISLGIRASEEYAAWVEELAAKDRRTMSAVVDQALAAYASAIGFDKEPPPRIP
jgi:hypothetical protein